MLFIAGGLVAAGALMVAWALVPLLPLLRNDASYLCDVESAYRPASPVPLLALDQTLGEASWFPIGIRCRFWAGEGVPRVTNEIDWSSTYLAMIGVGLVVITPAVALWLYLRETK
ncbi:MAG: hypothetical protein ABWX59_09490 [Microbacteriaceae bacterium]